ncbi:FKBP-type peptidyl-prolyl cis-trans isomerase [Haloferula sp. A504]|uniref:FKBP-type peptidyl-prolyl cis-trans isomerase n=1 Tax=Haloferula sp. A504 TaxID=3373601 RepID=UPI0031CAABD7|nr:FKBP-type peptidyl-prolyl cis-trans isomerase [Verrucomicrobiaceae bacterium E54]
MKRRSLRYFLVAGLIAATPLAELSAQDSAPATDKMLEAPDDVAAVPADAEKSESGLAWKVLKQGEGDAKPSASDTVEVHYTGWKTDGTMFDSSVKRGQPAKFPLNGVIKGWTEGVQLMSVGEKRRFWIPADLAYGENPGGGRPGGLLVFDIELLAIEQAPEIPEDVSKSEGGISYKITQEGKGGDSPTAEDVITFHFTASTMTGEELQSTRSQPEPPSVPAAQLTPPMREMLTSMTVGEKRRAWLPGPGMPGGHAMVDFELISFKAAPEPPAVPEDVAAAPEDAEKTDSGLASKILAAGKGGDKPAATDTVKVHYTGWTTDGKMFDSSITRGQPAQFPLTGVIKGWTEGLQLMTVGEKRRFWIPADLAYGENPGGGRPGGLLVFDVELLEIVR